MGQYYKCCILAENKRTVLKWLYSHAFDSGLKLMEHSWSKNPFVRAFETLIQNNPQRVVWGGDYAEHESDRKTNTYDRCVDSNEVKPEQIDKNVKVGKYLVNHSKKQFVDKTKGVDKGGWKIHPLPLLTARGNGMGGGDFNGEDKNNLVGSWAYDLISVENKKPVGYKELLFNLVE